MKSQICDILDIEFPLVAFSHCRDVVAAVSKAGGMGVLGAVGLTPEKLEIELNWIDENVNGKPYGVDVLVPNSYVGKGENLTHDFLIKEANKFTKDIIIDYGGNFLATYTGKLKKKIVIGSHLDSQKHGGNFDGLTGVIMGLVLIKSLEYPVSPA